MPNKSTKPVTIPKKFRLMWNNKRTGHRLDVPKIKGLKVGTKFSCSYEKMRNNTVRLIYTELTELNENG